MPTWEKPQQFLRDYARLSEAEQRLFLRAVQEFVEDLKAGHGRFRAGLRVKSVKGYPRVMEMTWDHGNGRATWQYGEEKRKGEPHVIWRRVGGHDIFDNP